MKITRRGLFGMLAAIPLAAIVPFRKLAELRTLAWKVEYKAATLNPSWVARINGEEYAGFLGDEKERLRKLMCEHLELHKKFMEPHTVKL